MKKILIFSFLVSSIIISVVIYELNDLNIKKQLSQATKIYNKSFETIYNEKKLLSKILFTGISLKTNLPQKLYKIKYSNQSVKNKMRDEFHHLIQKRYKELEKMSIMQLHVHLPDTSSFYRAHSPKIYGDLLAQYRPTVDYVSKNRSPIDTFETGKITHGFRFVYPLFYKNEFVGSIEVSFSAAAITKSLMEHYNVLCNFYIDTSVVNKKLLNKDKNFYKLSHHKDYYNDIDVLKTLKKVSNKTIKELIPQKQTVQKVLKAGVANKPSSIYDDKIKSIFTVIPIKNKIINKNVAFLTLRSSSDKLITSMNYTYSLIFLSILLNAAIFFIIYTLLLKSKQKEMEKIKLQEQKDEFETIFNHSHTATIITTLQGDVLNYNKTFISLFELEKEQFKTKNYLDIVDCKNIDQTKKAFKNVLVKGYVENIENSLNINNKTIDINLSISLLPDRKRLLLVLQDISNLKTMYEQSKLVALGEMIGNIAHQWRQPLNIITTSATTMMLKSDLGEMDKNDFKYFINNILDQSQYLSKTIDDFRNFIKSEDSYKIVTLKELLDESLNLIEPILKPNYIKLIKEVDDDIDVNVNKNEIIQALLNIINNAKDALIDNVKDETKRYIFIKSKLVDKNSIDLYIYDNGGGIDESILEKIFEPYFTTKYKSMGTGIGLSMVDQIIRVRHDFSVKASNIKYDFEGNSYKGACFKITFKSTL